jgi:hypothetical protein
MLNHFYVRLVHDNLAKRHKQCSAMHLMAGLFLLIFCIQSIWNDGFSFSSFMMTGFPTIMIFAVTLFSKKDLAHPYNNSIFRVFEIGLLAMAAEFYFRQNFLLIGLLFILVSLFLIVLLIMEYRFFSTQFIDFYESHILIPKVLFDKKVKWQNVRHVKLNNDLITIEYKNNVYFQHHIFNSLTPDEAEQFDTFCAKKIF